MQRILTGPKKEEEKAPELSDFGNREFKVYRSQKENDRRKANRPSLCLQDEGVLPYSLLYYKTPVKKEVMNDELFYKERLNTEFGEVSSLEAMNKEYCHFVVIAFSDDNDSKLTVELKPEAKQEEQKNAQKTVIPKVEVKRSFIFPRALDREQHIFLSRNFRHLIDIHENEASIYELSNGSPVSDVRFVGDVKKLPFGAFDGDPNQLLWLFSEDFLSHIDIDPVGK